jgi:hypothetical protein
MAVVGPLVVTAVLEDQAAQADKEELEATEGRLTYSSKIMIATNM